MNIRRPALQTASSAFCDWEGNSRL